MNDKFDPLSLTKKEYKPFDKEKIKSFGTILIDHPKAKKQSLKFRSVRRVKRIPDLPDVFDGRDTWRDFLSPIRDQGQCGNCWAIATTSVLSDRYAIQSLNQINIEFSPYATTVCAGVIDSQPYYDDKVISQKNLEAHSEAACSGNTIYNALSFLYIYGAMEHSCYSKGLFKEKGISYLDDFKTINDLPTCQELAGRDFDQCLNSDIAARYFRSIGSYTIEENPADNYLTIREEIYQFGPVISGFIIYDDFLEEYDGTTIYMGPKKESSSQGGHAIKIVGWGREKVDGQDVNYWWIGNSWGKNWGIGGFFKMKMGIPECQLEKNIATMIPDIKGLKIVYDFITFEESPTEILARKEFKIDSENGYLLSAIRKIKEGKLKGSLKPLVEKDSLPDFTKIYAGQIEIYPGLYSSGVFSDTFRETHPKKIGYVTSIILWLFIIVIIITIYFLKR